jgi:hypothetical protein
MSKRLATVENLMGVLRILHSFEESLAALCF